MIRDLPETAFWRNFKELARKKCLSPSVAAEQAGFNRSVITSWRKGRIPSRKTIMRLAAFFEVEPKYLFEEEHPTADGAGAKAVSPKAGVSAVYGKTGLFIVTENNAGEPYVITADNHQEILDDRTGGRKFVPADGARVFFASQDGKPISPYEYHDFSSLLLFLRGTARQSA